MSKYSNEDLYVYRLGTQVLQSLELMYFNSDTVQEVEQQLPPITNTSATATSAQEAKPMVRDKDYYKSDLYKLNLKRESHGLPPLSEQEFDELCEVESISGSEDEDEDDEDDLYHDRKDSLDTIFEKSIAHLEQLSTEDQAVVSHLATRSPYILFKSALLDGFTCFGAYKSLFNIKEIKHPLKSLEAWQSKQGKSAIFMIGGGHFAGAIVNHSLKSIKGNAVKQGQDPRLNSVEFLEHKSFHRYTTRRKQGGSQSAMDNAKGKANSAGSNLRRANEMALQNEVRELLSQWRKELDQCDSIFIRANGVQNRKILVFDGSPLQTDDTRIRSIPFTTKRPTTTELKRVWLELTSLTITSRPKVDDKKLKLRLVQEQLKQSQQQKIKQVDEITPEEKHTREIIGFLKKSRGPVLITYMKKHGLSPDFRLAPDQEYYHTPTVLHYASAHGIKNLIGVLLKTMKCDPTVQNKSGKTPYDLSANTSVKQAFRIARHELGEGAFDWDKSHVDTPISRDELERQEQERQNQEAEEKKELQRKELEKRTEPISAPKQRLGGVSLSHSNINSLTDDQRMRLMREQRARAAEARMRLQQQK
jgi:hypothetical protein